MAKSHTQGSTVRSPIQDQLSILAERFARDVLRTVSTFRFDDLLAMAQESATDDAAPSAPRHNALRSAPSSSQQSHRPAGLVRRSAPVALTAVSTGPAVKRKRNWPSCGEAGCSGSYYPASGTARLCYNHFIASGGLHPSKKR